MTTPLLSTVTDFILWLFCDVCGCDQPFALTEETGTDEIYTCSVCGKVRRFTVR